MLCIEILQVAEGSLPSFRFVEEQTPGWDYMCKRLMGDTSVKDVDPEKEDTTKKGSRWLTGLKFKARA